MVVEYGNPGQAVGEPIQYHFRFFLSAIRNSHWFFRCFNSHTFNAARMSFEVRMSDAERRGRRLAGVDLGVFIVAGQ